MLEVLDSSQRKFYKTLLVSKWCCLSLSTRNSVVSKHLMTSYHKRLDWEPIKHSITWFKWVPLFIGASSPTPFQRHQHSMMESSSRLHVRRVAGSIPGRRIPRTYKMVSVLSIWLDCLSAAIYFVNTLLIYRAPTQYWLYSALDICLMKLSRRC